MPFLAALALLITLAGPIFYPGASIRFEHLTIDDGLSQNAGLALLQDRQGYLWIGTQDGLNRYDGYSFTHFKHDPDDPTSLGFNSIIALYEDQQGFLWIGTWGGGLNRYDPASGQFTSYRPDPADAASLSHPIVTSLYQDDSGRLWVGTLGGLDLLDPASGRFTHFRNDPTDPASLSSSAVAAIQPAGDGKLWVGTGAFSTSGVGLNRFDPATGKAERFPAAGACLQSANISSLLPVADGSLWIGYGGYGLPGGGLDRYNPQTGACSHFEPQAAAGQITDNNVTRLLIDQAGSLWVASWSGGLWRLDAAKPNGLTVFRHDPADPNSLSNDSVYSLFQDRSGVLWVGTLSAGLNKLNLKNLQFRTYRHSPSDPNSIASDHVGAFAETSDGSLWVGTWESGLARFDPATGRFTHYRNDPHNDNSLSSDLVMSLYADPDGTLWAGTLGGGLNHFDPRAETFTRYRHDPAGPASLPGDELTSITRDAAGRLWVSTMAGLARLDPGSDGFVQYLVSDRPGGISGPPVQLKVYDDTLWVGTWGGGVYRLDLALPASLDPQQAAFEALRHDPENPNSLSEDSVWAIHRTRDGRMWFGTQGGLNRYDPASGTFKVYTEKDGLRNATILGILEDPRGWLWISTNNGLARFDPQSETFHIYDKSDGLQGNEFNSNASFASPTSGDFYFGGVMGFTAFNPLSLPGTSAPPTVAITDFKLFNLSHPFDRTGREPVELRYRDNFISFEFAALDFHAPGRNVYRYKLEGFDPDWVEAGARRYASYTNLPGGQYTFRVQGANSDGVWNEAGASLRLEITPPYWQRREFIFAALLLAVGLVVGGYQWRIQAVRADARRLETQVSNKTAQLREANSRLAVEVEQRARAEAELARRSAEALQQSEERFRAVFENAAIGIGVTSLDYKILNVNAALTELLGYTFDEMTGDPPPVFVHPDDRELDRELYRELIAGERASFQIEKRYLHKSGRLLWVRLTASALRGLDGRPLYLIGLVEDITARKQMQEDLRESEGRFRAILDNAAVGVAVMTLDRRIVQINQTATSLTGYTADEMSRLDPSSLAYEEDRFIDRHLFQDMVAGRRSQYQVEKRYIRKDGTLFWGRVNFSLVRGANGKPLYTIGLIEDISQEKQAAERLAAQEAEYRRTLEQRIAERTEELGRANQLLQHKAAQEAVAAERSRLARELHDAVTQTLFSATLIADVIPDLWEMNPAEGQRRLAELHQLTRGALAEMRTLLVELRPNALVEAPLPILLRQLTEGTTGRARLPVQLNAEGERKLPPDVQIALYRIAQEALNNVVKHAKATQAVVTLRLGELVRLTVADNGAGFDPATVTADHLGLKIMRERAEAIGARFSVYSEPGEGAQISVTWQDSNPAG